MRFASRSTNQSGQFRSAAQSSVDKLKEIFTEQIDVKRLNKFNAQFVTNYLNSEIICISTAVLNVEK